MEAEVPADATLWEGTELAFDGPLRVSMSASVAGTGEIVVRGTVEGTLDRRCRRCLKPVEEEVDRELTLVYAPRDELSPGQQDEGATMLIDPSTTEIDLGEAIRQELILDTDRFIVCEPECQGLCPLCGIDLNEETCECTLEEPDPRWDALRELKSD